MLGAQPPTPGTLGLRYVDSKETTLGLEMVISQPYYRDEDYPFIDQARELWDPEYNQEPYVQEANPLLLLGPHKGCISQASRFNSAQGSLQVGSCFDCGGDHWNCPQRLQSSGPPKPISPPIERLYFPKDSPTRPLGQQLLAQKLLST